jgi:hypothetical protein
MSNPYLPLWEYIPDGEPRVFGDRVYIYGSHDRVGSNEFCDYKLKVWSAPLNDLNNWVCHGHIFHTQPDADHSPDTDWTTEANFLYAPDVVEKGGKYYLYAYIMNGLGCVAVSDKPEGPFTLLSKYKYNVPEGREGDFCNNGWFIDPGVLVDDDGRVYIYCGFERSFVAELNPDNMYEVIDGTYKDDIIPKEGFFEACSPRKVGDTYYLIYSPTPRGSCLAYATSKSPTEGFEFRGYIVDNSEDYPGGNNHGSICNINGQWYIFYHRMTNGSIMSRRDCVERIEILPDGTIPQVEMTSLGFEESLNPYRITPAEIACVLKNGGLIAEKDIFTRVVTGITDGCVIGYKYFDFGEDYSSKTMLLSLQTSGCGNMGRLHVRIDGENGEEIGCAEIGLAGGVVQARVKAVTGRHALYFVADANRPNDWTGDLFKGRQLFELISFVFSK